MLVVYGLLPSSYQSSWLANNLLLDLEYLGHKWLIFYDKRFEAVALHGIFFRGHKVANLSFRFEDVEGFWKQ